MKKLKRLTQIVQETEEQGKEKHDLMVDPSDVFFLEDNGLDEEPELNPSDSEETNPLEEE